MSDRVIVTDEATLRRLIVGVRGGAEVERLLTVRDVMERCAISASAAYALMGRVENVRIGRSIRVSETVLAAYIEQGGDECRISTGGGTRRTGGAGATTRTASVGRSRQSSALAGRRRKQRALLKGSD